jgi:hypothetical protein
MIELSGELPSEWKHKWEEMKLKARLPPQEVKPSSTMDENFPTVQDRDLKILLQVIQGLTKLLPSDRISAAGALWLVEQGLIANGRMRA